MEQDLSTAVADFRRRLADQATEVQRLKSIVKEMEAPGPNADLGRVKSSLRHARAGLAKTAVELAELQRIYARFRLREGIGRDPGSLDDDAFDEELLAFMTGPLTRRGVGDPRDGKIGFDTFRQMILSDQPLGQLVHNERAERKGTAAYDPVADELATKTLLRKWAASTRSDPFVARSIAGAAAAAERFTRCLSQFQDGLNDVRINYEISRRTVDKLTFIAEGDRVVIQAENRWASVQETFPDEAARLVEQFYGLRQAHKKLTAVRSELNHELRRFLAAFTPRYLTCVRCQSRARRRRLGLAGANLRRLCAYLLDEIERTDFLLPGGGGVEIALPRIPRDVASFSRTEAYRAHKKAVEEKAADAVETA